MRKCVMISLDALYDADLAFYDENTYIGRLLRRGAVSSQVKTIFPALTYPAHVTLITGTRPHQHGVGHNQPFQPEVEPAHRRWYWEMGHIRSTTLFDLVKAAGGRSASLFWPVTGKSYGVIRWNMPETIALPGENQIMKILRYGSPWWIITTALKYQGKMKGFTEPWISDLACDMACDVIKKHQPDLTAIHFVDLDEMRHLHGTHSSEAREALRRMDERVRRVHEAMQTAGMEDALLILVSDHGQADYTTCVPLEDALKKGGVEARVQSCGMSAYVFTDEPVLAENILAGAQGVGRVYNRNDLNGMGCPEDVSLAVEAAPGVVFDDGMPQTAAQKASHGYGPGHPAENCLFAVMGAGISLQILPQMAMVDVAPTVAELMGLRFSTCEGESLAHEITHK